MSQSQFLRSTVGFFCLMLLAVPSAQANLIGVHYQSGNLYSISTLDASLSLIGNTGVAKLGSLELAPDGYLMPLWTAATSKRPVESSN